MPAYNIKTVKKCAFCKFWWDPTYEVIEPKAPITNMWNINSGGKKMCLKKNYEMSADSSCGQYQCKLKEYIN